MEQVKEEALSLNAIEADVIGRLRTAGRPFYIFLALSGLLVLAATVAGVQSMLMGHEAYFNVYREVPWGMLIATYVFFVVTSTGLCLVSSIGHVFGVQNFMPIAKRSVYLSIATLLAGFFVIAFEIKLPWRMAVYNIISPNFTSNIWWMGTLYGVSLVLKFSELFFLNLDRHRPAVICGFTGAVAGIGAQSNLGAVFGLLMGRELWHGPYMPIYLLASAMMTGCAAIIFFHCLSFRVNRQGPDAEMKKALSGTAKLAALMTCIIFIFTTWKMISGLAGQPSGHYEAVTALVKGPFATNFWLFEIGLGMALPLVLLYSSRGTDLRRLLLAAASMIIGIFVTRYDMVVVGQIVPSFHELGVMEYSGLLEYYPSLYEGLIALGGFGLTAFLFLLGEKLFDGHKVETDH